MLCTTNNLIRTALKTDPTLTTANRATILAAIKNPELSVPPKPRILRRREVAARFSVSIRCVDAWAKKGILKKRILPSHIRASGFLSSEIDRLLAGEVSHG